MTTYTASIDPASFSAELDTAAGKHVSFSFNPPHTIILHEDDIPDATIQAVITAHNPVKATTNAAIDAQIHGLEQTELYPRGLREFMLSGIEKEAIAIGATMNPPLDAAASIAAAYAGNILYRNLKNFDNKIASLRAQRIK